MPMVLHARTLRGLRDEIAKQVLDYSAHKRNDARINVRKTVQKEALAKAETLEFVGNLIAKADLVGVPPPAISETHPSPTYAIRVEPFGDTFGMCACTTVKKDGTRFTFFSGPTALIEPHVEAMRALSPITIALLVGDTRL